jgi:hypothetical protein
MLFQIKLNRNFMQDLIQKLQKGHGLTPEQSYEILNTIKEFIIEKFPMMGGALDNFFPAEVNEQRGTDTDKAQAVAGATPTGDTGTTAGPTPKGGSFLDPESDIPGEEGEREKQTAKDRLSDMVNPDKTDKH